jgi:hypothetical protein
MPYVSRNAAGQITALHRSADSGAGEYLQPTDPEVQRFLGVDDAPQRGSDFAPLDDDFVRVLEDVVDTLIRKGLLTITDLPDAAQAKLFARKSFRKRDQARGEAQAFKASGFVEIIDDSSFGGLSQL